MAALALMGAVLLAAFPARAYVAQRHERERLAAQVSTLAAQNRHLEERARQLQSDAEIERLARQHYNLVRPGEEAFAIITPRPPPTPAAVDRRPPSPAPWWQRLLTRLTDLF